MFAKNKTSFRKYLQRRRQRKRDQLQKILAKLKTNKKRPASENNDQNEGKKLRPEKRPNP